MKHVYICGDSFGCPDLSWDIDPWPVILARLLGAEYTVTNLSISCASNLLIRMQVDRAVAQGADYVIMLATTCTRGQGRVRESGGVHDNIYDRFVRIGSPDSQNIYRDLACYSIPSLDETCVFSAADVRSIRDYHARLFDLDLAIYENQCVIESSLHALARNHIPFVFDQGGFENPIFGNVKSNNYFAEFVQHRSQINQWTLCHGLPKSLRPHLHIVDPDIHKTIAQYFHLTIINELANEI